MLVQQEMSEFVSCVKAHALCALTSMKRQIGVTKALLEDLKMGYLTSLEEMIHGDLFSDYLEMADHLVQHGYKDAAAVLAGATLELQLKKLCNKHSIGVQRNGKPRKADELNAELGKLRIYSKLVCRLNN